MFWTGLGVGIFTGICLGIMGIYIVISSSCAGGIKRYNVMKTTLRKVLSWYQIDFAGRFPEKEILEALKGE